MNSEQVVIYGPKAVYTPRDVLMAAGIPYTKGNMGMLKRRIDTNKELFPLPVANGRNIMLSPHDFGLAVEAEMKRQGKSANLPNDDNANSSPTLPQQDKKIFINGTETKQCPKEKSDPTMWLERISQKGGFTKEAMQLELNEIRRLDPYTLRQPTAEREISCNNGRLRKNAIRMDWYPERVNDKGEHPLEIRSTSTSSPAQRSPKVRVRS